MIKNLTLIILILLTNCGYQPIYLNQELKDLEFFEINSTGDQLINNTIINSLNLKVSKSSGIDNQLYLNSNYDIRETSKDASGLVNTYQSNIKVNFTIKKNEQIVKSKTFTSSFSYGAQSSKFKLVEYQKDVKTNLLNQIIEEIILFINIK